ncbi:MAG: saccharopine dehydrogenase NADP-binding domain-containing protein [Candidatus Hodarchaeota archaeon]
MKITVLGGCGAVGSIAVKMLAMSGVFSDVLIGDINLAKAQNLASTLGANVSAIKVDALNSRSIEEAISGSSVVLNFIGPFYKFGPSVMKATISSGINYVDICDDVDATEDLMAMNKQAKDSGVSALIGMGSSPGISNSLVRFCADYLLDDVESIDIYHAHGGEEEEGPAVIKHRIHSMLMEIPVFLDGRFKKVRLFGKGGSALEEEVDFPGIGRYRVYAYPHPETITLPKYIKGVKRVTNLGLVLPPSYAELIKGIVRLGMTSEEPINIGEKEISPLEFAVFYAISQRERLLKEAGIREPMGSLKIVVKGKKEGESNTYTFSLSSKGRGMGEGTAIPAALGAILMSTGQIGEKGVFPPEGGVNPLNLLKLAKKFVKIGDRSGLPIAIEHIDGRGNIRTTGIESLAAY